MDSLDDGRLKVVQIACGSLDEKHVLYALTEDGRIWYQVDGAGVDPPWFEEPPIPAGASQWRRKREDEVER